MDILNSIKTKGKPLLLLGGMLLAFLVLTQFAAAHKAYAASSWTASTGYSSTQGLNQWTYQQRAIATGVYTNLTTNTSGVWVFPAAGWMTGNASHPDNTYDTVRKWVAPAAGNVSITGRVKKNDTGGGNGVIASVLKNSTSIWSQTIAYNDGVGVTTDASLSSVSVLAGDAIYFIVNNNGDWGYDDVGWDPTITYLTPITWTASTGYSGTQGLNQWFYQERVIGTTTYTNMPTYTSNVWVGASSSWMIGGSTHPDNTRDSVRKWLAPSAGTISITGRVKKNDTGGGNGVIASVLKNNTTLWIKTLAYNDGTGYTTDADLSNVTVAAGDAIYFVVNNNGSNSNDETGWDPTITYVGAGPTWNLNTTDTNMSLTVRNNKPTITSLKNPTQNWNWAPYAVQIPLLNKIYIGATAYTPNWVYQDAVVDVTSGTKVTLRFTSTTPNLELKSTFWAQPGVGPVEENTTIKNNTGGNVIYNHVDAVASDFMVTADNTTTLTRFSRSSYDNGGDSGFSTGVFKDVMGTSSNIQSTVSNDYNPSNYVLPFEMLDRGSVHGLYMGYTWDFGRISNRTSGNALQIRSQFYLGDSGSVTEANNKIFNVPGMFFGTYQGDLDTGSNAMKKWFWNYKMTPTLKANTNEPLVEYDVNLFSEADFTTFFASNPLSSWGVELMKEDAWWTSDVYSDNYFGWAWDPDPAKWPSGMTLGTTAHTNGLKLSLYMANRYAHNDLATQAGRDAEKAALLTRYDNWHYDYWRSDMELENTNNYLSHEGLLEVLDYMIANRPNFRWENCSSGGSKKSFDLLQRQTVMTTEDSGASPGSIEKYRKAFYANSYMINPVQLKDDNGQVPPNTAAFYRYQYRTGFLGAWMNGNDTSQLAIYQAHVALYKTKQRPILRGADVYHILPMPDGTNWDGMEFFNTTLNKGSVLLFHPSSAVSSSKTIFFKGLVGATNYVLTFQDRPGQNVTKTGTELMTTGLTVTGLSADYDSEIIWIN